MTTLSRPLLATLLALAFLASALFMAWLALDAYAYFPPAACLLVQAFLLWQGRGGRCCARLLMANQLSAIVLVLDLWLGDQLHLPKLDISAAMLMANLALGGPLAGILAIVTLAAMHVNPALPGWLQHGRQP